MANFKIMRNGLNTEIVGDPHIGQSSEDVTVSITDDGTYQEYDKKLYYSYGYRNQIYRAIADENSSNEFVIPMTAFLEPGIVKLSLELSKGTNKPTCNACFISVTNGAKSVAASDILPDEETWQSYIQSYIKSNAEEFKGDTGPQGPRGEKGDPGSIENLKVGGVNLLSDTKNFDGDWVYKDKWNVSEEKYNGFTVLTNKRSWYGLQKNIKGKKGEKYTFSLYLKRLKQDGVITFYANLHGEATINNDEININVTDEWARYYFTFTLTSDGLFSPRVECSVDVEGVFAMCGLKLEREETPTDWTPSLEDYERNTLNYSSMESSTATHSYNVDDFVEVNGSLKKVTSTIAQGQEFNSSNTKDTTITDELKAIYALINK